MLAPSAEELIVSVWKVKAALTESFSSFLTANQHP